MKTCKSCKHYYDPWFDSSWRGLLGFNVSGPRCKKAFREEIRDPVTGKVTDPARFSTCEHERWSEGKRSCGPSGKWHEDK